LECGCARPCPAPTRSRNRQAFPSTPRQISPALIESTHAASGGQVIGQAVDGAVTLSPEEHNEMLQRAFQEGARLCGGTRPVWPASAAHAANGPRLAEARGAASGIPGEPAGRRLSQRVLHTGADYAAAQLAQQQAPERENILAQLAEQNEGKMQALAARIEELNNREYRPPSAPMGCKEEREAVLQCYRANRTPG